MHNKISVAVATRHRNKCLGEFLSSFYRTIPNINYPSLTVIHDSPDELYYDKSVYETDLCDDPLLRNVVLPEKSGLAELWNWCVMLATTDWVLICNDDVTFNNGWVEYLEEKIESDQYDMIHLFHYGAMCLHKRLILKLGWFDERYRGGGFEDTSHQLRISEAGLTHRIDRSHDFIRKEGNIEIGHFINHHKSVVQNGSWSGENNDVFFCEKWGRNTPWNLRVPSYRMLPEIDWHPSYTRKYEAKHGIKSNLNEINKLVGSSREIYL